MKSDYGSENAAFVRRVPTRRVEKSRKSKILGAIAVPLVIGGAYVALNHPTNPHVETTNLQALNPNAMATLSSGGAFQLRVPGKPNLCMDDGGGTKDGEKLFQLWPCDPKNPNQLFQYDVKTNQMRSVMKPNLCVDDGGGLAPGQAKFWLWTCDPKNPNQRFIYDQVTVMFRNPNKGNLCIDDGGGVAGGQTKFTLWTCDINNGNQRFEVMPVTPGTQNPVAQQRWVVDEPTLLSGAEFLLRVPGKGNLCVDDGGAQSAGQAQFVLWACDPNNLNQVFRYDPVTYSIRSSAKAGLCLDDGGGVRDGQTKYVLWNCDPNNNNQRFIYDRKTLQFRNPMKPNFCLDDGGGSVAGQTKFQIWTCGPNNINQMFEIIPRPLARPPAIIANRGDFAIMPVNVPGYCVDDGGSSGAGTTRLMSRLCDANSPLQFFRYDEVAQMFISSSKPTLCLDDGGGAVAGSSKFTLWTCDPKNGNQKFVFEEATQLIRSATKNLCIDHGGVPNIASYVLQPCDAKIANRRFLITPRGQMKPAVNPPGVVVPQFRVDHPVLLSGEEFLMRASDKENLCIDDGGGNKDGETTFTLWTCDPANKNQIFKYDPATYQIRSVTKPNLCVDDGGGTKEGEKKFWLWTCDPANNNQKFVYQTSSMQFLQPLKKPLCMDDGGGKKPGETRFTLWTCDERNINQRFRLIPRTAFGANNIPAPAPLPNVIVNPIAVPGRKFIVRQAQKGKLCMDDGGGRRDGETKFVLQPCNPLSLNQQFTYDMATKQLRSVGKPGMCADDGGGNLNGQTQFYLWTCHPDNRNQKFNYDHTTLMFTSVFKRNFFKQEMCMDDHGMTGANQKPFHLWACDVKNFNQKFEIVPVDDMKPIVIPGPKPPAQVTPSWPIDHPVLLNGGEFLLRLIKSANACVESGPTFVARECNFNNTNQVFRYDPVTYTIRSVTKADLCLDDNGPNAAFRLMQCDANSGNQKFVYNWGGKQLQNPLKAGQCMTSGEVKGSTLLQWFLRECMANAPFQMLEIVPRPGPGYEPKKIDNINQIPTINVTSPTDIAKTKAPAATLAPVSPPADGDWNLLAPSQNTIGLVDGDRSKDITPAEIFKYLDNIRDQAERQYKLIMYRYNRTNTCVRQGLSKLAKVSLSHNEYHDLVMWMFKNCAE